MAEEIMTDELRDAITHAAGQTSEATVKDVMTAQAVEDGFIDYDATVVDWALMARQVAELHELLTGAFQQMAQNPMLAPFIGG